MGKIYAVSGVIVLLIPLLVVILVAGSGCDPASASGSDSASGQTVDPDDIPVDNVGPYGKDQLVNAAIIMNAAADADLSKQAQIIGVMTAIGESTLQNVEHGDAAGPDSRGLFQQRAQGWGTEEQRLDPYLAAQAFYGVSDHAEAPGLVDIDGWEHLELTIAINRVQRNADPYHYEPYEDDARDIVAALADVPLAQGALGMSVASAGAGADALAGAGRSEVTEADLSVGPVKDHVLQAALVMANVFQSQGLEPGDIGGYRSSGSRDPNGHPAGLALDFMVPLDDDGKALGDAISQYAIDNADHLNVKYIIWYQRIYHIDRPGSGWQAMDDRGSATQNHLDHPHISFTAEATGNPEDAEDAPAMPGGSVEAPECEAPEGEAGDYPDGGPGPWGGHENGRIPEDELRVIPWAPREFLRADATEQLIEMNNAFKDEFGTDIAITDAYRPIAEQEHLYRTKPPGMAAKPGTSIHGWALAVDLGSGINSFGTPQHEWMQRNAGDYGWVHPEWASQGGSTPEAWHWEFGK